MLQNCWKHPSLHLFRSPNVLKLSLLAILACSSPSFAQTSSQITVSSLSKSNELIVGTTDSTYEADVTNMSERLKAGLGDYDNIDIIMQVESSSAKLQKEIDKDKLDIVFSHGLGAINVLAISPTAPIMQTVDANYASIPLVFAVKKDSPIKSLDDLAGLRLGLKNTRQRRSFFAPTWLLLTNGMELSYLDNLRVPVNPETNAVSLAFAGHEENLTDWLHRGFIDAAAYSLRDWEDEEKVPLKIRETFRTIYDDNVLLNGYAIIMSHKAIDMKPSIMKALAPLETGDTLIDRGFTKITPEHTAYLTEISKIMTRGERGYLNRE